MKYTHETAGYFSLVTHPLYDVIALLTIAATALVCAFNATQQREACFGLLLAVGLWLYPSTAAHYCVLLLPAMCAVRRDREKLALSSTAVGVFFGLQYVLLNFRGGASTIGVALAFDCVFFAVLSFRRAAPGAPGVRSEALTPVQSPAF